MRQVVYLPGAWCLCGHPASQHRLDLRIQGCTSAACGCRDFRLGTPLETRVAVTVPAGQDTDLVGRLARAEAVVAALRALTEDVPGDVDVPVSLLRAMLEP